RKVVARDAGDAKAAAAGAEQSDRSAEVDLVERAGRRERRVGPDRRLVAEPVSRGGPELKDLGEDREQKRPPVVEVPADQARGAVRNAGELGGPREQADLPRALAGRKPQVQVEHVKVPGT